MHGWVTRRHNALSTVKRQLDNCPIYRLSRVLTMTPHSTYDHTPPGIMPYRLLGKEMLVIKLFFRDIPSLPLVIASSSSSFPSLALLLL